MTDPSESGIDKKLSPPAKGEVNLDQGIKGMDAVTNFLSTYRPSPKVRQQVRNDMRGVSRDVMPDCVVGSSYRPIAVVTEKSEVGKSADETSGARDVQ